MTGEPGPRRQRQIELGEVFDKWDTAKQFSPQERQVAIHFAEHVFPAERQEGWVNLGTPVYVSNPQFTGYGIAQYDTGERKRAIGVKLENGNVWEYDAATVRNALPDEYHKMPKVLRDALPAPPSAPEKLLTREEGKAEVKRKRDEMFGSAPEGKEKA